MACRLIWTLWALFSVGIALCAQRSIPTVSILKWASWTAYTLHYVGLISGDHPKLNHYPNLCIMRPSLLDKPLVKSPIYYNILSLFRAHDQARCCLFPIIVPFCDAFIIFKQILTLRRYNKEQ